MASQGLSDGALKVDLRSVVGHNIRLRRDTLGLSNRELADSAEIEVRLLSKHMKGDSMPSPATLVLYAQKLDRPVSWFFDNHDET